MLVLLSEILGETLCFQENQWTNDELFFEAKRREKRSLWDTFLRSQRVLQKKKKYNNNKLK